MINFSGNPIRCGCDAAGSFLVGTWLSLVEHSLGVRGVGSSNLPVPTNSLLESNMERYLQELRLTRKPATENRSRQILFEALPFLTGDPRQGILNYLSAQKSQGASSHTLSNKRIRCLAFF